MLADPSELANLGVATVDELVERINEERCSAGRMPVTQGDFPENKAAFTKLAKELRGSGKPAGQA